jgi:hypothetical protein
VKPLKKEYAARKAAWAARVRDAEHRAARASASTASSAAPVPSSPTKAGAAATSSTSADAFPPTPAGTDAAAAEDEDWRPLSAQLRLKAASFTATFAPKVVAALHAFAAQEAASFQEARAHAMDAQMRNGLRCDAMRMIHPHIL